MRSAPLHAPSKRACLQRVHVVSAPSPRPGLPGQSALSAGGRGRHRPLETRAPIALGHRGVGGDAAIGLGLGGGRGRSQVVRWVVVQRVEIREGTLRQQNISHCVLRICFTWFGPLGSGSYRSDKVVKGFRELRNRHAMKSIFYYKNSFPYLRGTTGPDTFLISIIL